MAKKRYTKEEMQKLLGRYKSSKLGRAAFCARENINTHTFDYWRSKLNRLKKEKTSVGFIPVVPEVAASHLPLSILIRLSAGHEIELPKDYPPSDLQQLIRLLLC